MKKRSPRAAFLVLLLLTSSAVASAACTSEAGLWTPKNPGTVRASVRDTAGSPVSGAQVMVEIPNDVGSVFRTGSRSGDNGVVTIHGVPEGTRPVDVTPPPGFSIDPAQRVQLVEVRENRTASVTFVLTRN